jgi:hypothetical protein
MYRIKIEERNNGEKRYIPQVGKPLFKIGRFNYKVDWWNIVYHKSRFIVSERDISKITTVSHDTEEEALLAIEQYKVLLQTLKGEEVKTTTYKVID